MQLLCALVVVVVVEVCVQKHEAFGGNVFPVMKYGCSGASYLVLEVI